MSVRNFEESTRPVTIYDMSSRLSFNHLYAFWMIAEAGGISAAAKRMHVTHSTLSVQLRNLERVLGAELFERRGRGLVITPFGDEIHARAGEIFRLGRDLSELAKHESTGRTKLRVGVLASLPKTITCRLLEPAFDSEVTIDILHGPFDRLLETLAGGRAHVVLADQAPPQGTALRLHAHLLGESELVVYGTEKVVATLEGKFPSCLHGAPMLMPRPGALRRQLDEWLGERELRVDVVGEIDDAGSLRAFGLRGHGLFPVRSALTSEVADVKGARRIGTLDTLRERYYAITRERTVRHPALVRLIDHARARFDG
jgi:LysR family transcriptional regulator, transcriptional activator of nhaA